MSPGRNSNRVVGREEKPDVHVLNSANNLPIYEHSESFLSNLFNTYLGVQIDTIVTGQIREMLRGALRKADRKQALFVTAILARRVTDVT
jgi:hypothetical protein